MGSLSPIVQFTGGEWAPSMDTRYDLEGYRNACRKLQNVIPTKQGGAQRRPGTQWIAQGKINSAGTASISSFRKFQVAPGVTFQLEFCDQGIRFCANGVQITVNPTSMPNWTNGNSYAAGAFVNVGGIPYYLYNGPLNNSIVSPGSDPTHWVLQAVYEVPAPYSGTNFTAPNYWTADVANVQLQVLNDVAYIVHPNFPVYKLTRYTNVYTGVPNTGWVMQQVQFLLPPMLDENATDETLTASAVSGSVTLTAAANSAWAGTTVYVPGNTVSSGGVVYNCLQTHTSGTFANDVASGYWATVTNFVAGHVGSYWQLAYNRPTSFIEFDATGSSASYTFSGGSWYSSGATFNGTAGQFFLVGTWEVQTYGVWQSDITIQVSYDNAVTWQTITILSSRGDANYSISGQELNGGVYRFTLGNNVAWASSTPPRIVLTAENQFIYGLVKITAVANAYSATATVIGAQLYNTASTIFWSEGAWSAVRGYPQAVTVFQERVWYGYSAYQPQNVWASQTNDIENFALYDQSQSTYGLAFTLNAPGRGPIQWLAAQTDLFVGMASAEWIISSGSATSAITPTAIQALEHTVNGSAPNLPALIIGQACMYVQRRARTFQQMMFSVFTNKYMSQDMQTTSQHLTNAGIVQFDYQQEWQNQPIIWAVCGDGTLISMTYAMEQKVFAWAGHSTGTDAGDKVISVQVIYGVNGADDEVWVTVLRDIGTNNGKGCQLERLWPVDWQTYNSGAPQLNQMCYADCATFFTYGAPPFANTNSIYGLPLCLVGRTLVASIVPASGSGAWAIRSLTCTLQSSGPFLGWAYVTIPNYQPAQGDVVCVGLPINWQIEPMRLDLDPRMGPTSGLTKSIESLYLRTLNSIGGQWSCYGAPPVAGQLTQVKDIEAYPITANTNTPPALQPNVPLDVDIEVGGLFGYSLDPAFAIQGYDPLPFYLLGITVKSNVAGRV